ncbi:FUSC family protein [Streptomyces sp. NPDC054855]
MVPMRHRFADAWEQLRLEASAIGRSASNAAHRQGAERDTLVQALKAAGAAIAAWALAGWWLKAPMALMAPWTAMALVDVTVYRSLRVGLQQLAVIVAGTLAASFAMVLTDGNTMAAMAFALPLLTLFGTYRRFGTQGFYGASSALFVITYGSYQPAQIGHRLLETAIGAGIGIAVNALVLPPVHLRDVREQLQRLGHESADLLESMARTMREDADWGVGEAEEWYDRAGRLEAVLAAVAEARQWSTESSRCNPGRYFRRTVPPPPAEMDDEWRRIVSHLVAATRTLASAVREHADLTAPAAPFSSALAGVAEQAARICRADARALHPSEAHSDAVKKEREDACGDALRAYEALRDGFAVTPPPHG